MLGDRNGNETAHRVPNQSDWLMEVHFLIVSATASACASRLYWFQSGFGDSPKPSRSKVIDRKVIGMSGSTLRHVRLVLAMPCKNTIMSPDPESCVTASLYGLMYKFLEHATPL